MPLMTPRLVQDPNANDIEHALDEIVVVMRKYGFVLGAMVEKPGVMLLGRISDGANQSTVVAEIHQITPIMVDWRPILGSEKPVKIQ